MTAGEVAATARPRRSFLAPEVIQTSAMDCGPAALKCLLNGFGIEASYGRLREACQTDVDGTSIDTLEAIGQALGLDIGQTMLPVDWLLLPEAEALPCLVVVQVPGGGTHFLVVWRRFGPWLQLMDPATGRRWVRCAEFEKEIYRHEQALPAGMLRRWLGSSAPQAVLKSRLSALGLAANAAESLLEAAESDAGYQGFATLDGALRLAELLQARRALAKGEPAHTLVKALLAEPERIPSRLLAISGQPKAGKPAPDQPAADTAADTPADAPAEEPLAFLRGAVFLKVSGPRPEGADADLPADLRAALTETKAQPLRRLWELLREGGAAPLWIIALAAAISSAGAIALGLALRGFVDLRGELPLAGQRLFALLALAVFAGGLLWVEAPAVAALLRAARGLELRLRLRFAEKVPRLADRYFRSRPRSDMAERAHALHHIRQVPELMNRLLRAGLGLVASAAGIVWLDGDSAWLAALAVLLAFALPLLALPSLCEQDLKLRSHNGALTRFNFDALLGQHALRAHGAHGEVGRAHRHLLGEWASAAGRFASTSIGVEVGLMALLQGLAIALVFTHLARGGIGSGSLLLAFWALLLPLHGLDLARALWLTPALRSVTLRLLEPLGAREEEIREGPATREDGGAKTTAVGFRFEEVTVKAGGHKVLENINLELLPGEHLAVVGPSGAGKSSLLGLLLGWHQPSSGRVLVDGAPLDAAALAELRLQAAWIDPEVQLWNETCLGNLLYGAPEGSLGEVGRALREAELESLIEKLPAGLSTPLGEGGARFSGGEGQRVRIGRALLKAEARLVLLDEPFRGLARESRDRLLGRLREVYRGTTLIFISHDVAQALDFPRVVVIEEGGIAEDGSPEGLMALPQGRLRSLIEREAGLRERLASEEGWRRLELREGRLVEHSGIKAPAVKPAEVAP